MAEAFTGFRFAYRLSKQTPTIQPVTVADAAFHEGDLINLESGQADLAIASDAALMGICLETKSGMTAGTDQVKVITDEDAVYAVYDQNARLIGATLDISGATGAQTVGATSHADLTVVADSGADELTYVRITHGEHWLN